MGFRVLDHTADTGIEVEALSLDGLFVDAALGFAATMTDLDAVEARREQRFIVTSGDLESLMVDWLGELLYVFDVDGDVYSTVDVTVQTSESGRFRLEADCRGETFDADRHPLKVPIKAVTYHGLKVRQGPDGRWTARVVFDI